MARMMGKSPEIRLCPWGCCGNPPSWKYHNKRRVRAIEKSQVRKSIEKEME